MSKVQVRIYIYGIKKPWNLAYHGVCAKYTALEVAVHIKNELFALYQNDQA